MLLAIVGTLLHHEIVDYKWIAIGAGRWARSSACRWAGADDGRAAADRAEPRLRRLCVTLVGIGGVLPPAPDVPPFMMSVLSLEVILGSLTFTGSLMAAGKLQEILPQRPITYQGPELRQSRPAGPGRRRRGLHGAPPRAAAALPADRRDLRWSSA